MDILILGESPTLVAVIAPLLAESGHRARAMTQSEALGAPDGEQTFDACVVDLDRESGLPWLDRMRQQGRAVRAVAWTASEGLWRDLPATGAFHAFLAKPASFGMLLAALEGRACPACGLPIDRGHVHADCALGADSGLAQDDVDGMA